MSMSAAPRSKAPAEVCPWWCRCRGTAATPGPRKRSPRPSATRRTAIGLDAPSAAIAGVVYLAVTHFATPTAAKTFPFAATPGIGSHDLLKSFDGGYTWTKPVAIFKMNDACYHIDPVFNECTEDGIAGARSDLAPSPSL